MFPHLGGVIFGVEYSKLCEHAHVSSLQTECRLQKLDELLEEAPGLVEVNEFLQLVSVYHNVESAHLRHPELSRFYTRETHLSVKGVRCGLMCRVFSYREQLKPVNFKMVNL